MPSTSHYTTLGVSTDADAAALKRAYRKLAMKYHPDKNPGNTDAAAQFQAVSHAYEVLSDPEKRGVYDRYGEEGVQQMGTAAPRGDASDIFSQLFGGRPSRSRSVRPPVSRADAEVPLTTLVLGGDITVQCTDSVAKHLPTGKTCTQFVTCPTCEGGGTVTQTRMLAPGMFQQSQGICEACEARGYVIEESVAEDCMWMEELKEHTTHVMAGQSLREPLVLYEKGRLYVDPETHTVRRGDLHVRLTCTAAPEWSLYSPQHRHILWTPTLQVVYGLLTNRIRCPHPDGSEYVFEMPDKHRTETVIVPGKGLPASDREPAGDLFIRVLWDFSPTMLQSSDWFKQMQTGLVRRAPWADPTKPTDETCMTTEAYEKWQQQPSPTSSQPPRRPSGATDGRPECVQS